MFIYAYKYYFQTKLVYIFALCLALWFFFSLKLIFNPIF